MHNPEIPPRAIAPPQANVQSNVHGEHLQAPDWEQRLRDFVQNLESHCLTRFLVSSSSTKSVEEQKKTFLQFHWQSRFLSFLLWATSLFLCSKTLVFFFYLQCDKETLCKKHFDKNMEKFDGFLLGVLSVTFSTWFAEFFYCRLREIAWDAFEKNEETSFIWSVWTRVKCGLTPQEIQEQHYIRGCSCKELLTIIFLTFFFILLVFLVCTDSEGYYIFECILFFLLLISPLLVSWFILLCLPLWNRLQWLVSTCNVLCHSLRNSVPRIVTGCNVLWGRLCQWCNNVVYHIVFSRGTTYNSFSDQDEENPMPR